MTKTPSRRSIVQALIIIIILGGFGGLGTLAALALIELNKLDIKYSQSESRLRDLEATPWPTSAPTATPQPVPTPVPTATPVRIPAPPTPQPTATPITLPTPQPTATPIMPPTPQPTATPVTPPTPQPTATPITPPTPQPTATPIVPPTPQPTATPIVPPTPQPTATPVIPASTLTWQLRESVPRIDQGSRHGTGMVFQTVDDSQKGGVGAYVLTNAHVVDLREARYPITVNFWDNDDWDFFSLKSERVGMDEDLDIAVVYACCDRRLHGLEMNFSREKHFAGAHVTMLGYPYGKNLSPSITAGIISALAEYTTTGQAIYLTDAPANPGNSGGPLLASTGEVIGMVTAKHVGLAIEGQAVAINVEEARAKVSELCDYRCEIP